MSDLYRDLEVIKYEKLGGYEDFKVGMSISYITFKGGTLSDFFLSIAYFIQRWRAAFYQIGSKQYSMLFVHIVSLEVRPKIVCFLAK